jgi:hypothetical protein
MKLKKFLAVALIIALLAILVMPLNVSAQDPVIIEVSNLQPSWTAAGGGGVFSAYIGPPAYGYASPGSTALYDGHGAGIIKAGLAVDPTSGNYEDEGLFGFQPNVTIDSFATNPLNYDVENQEGTNPVWMTIEVDTNIVGNRTDNTTYQYVPTNNPAGWHNVDAAAGQWQKWNNDNGDVTGNPLISLSQIATEYTGRYVVRAYLRLGMGNSYHGTGAGTIGWVDKVVIGSTTYDFVVNNSSGSSNVNGTLNTDIHLSVPPSTSIYSASLVSETAGIPSSNADVENKIASLGLSPIQVTLTNTGFAYNGNARIAPINANTHLQFWAKDTLNNWYDVNVTGWGPSAGFPLPGGYNSSTDVYIMSDAAGIYPITINLVDVPAGTTVASASGTLVVNPSTTNSVTISVPPSVTFSSLLAGQFNYADWTNNGANPTNIGQLIVTPGTDGVVPSWTLTASGAPKMTSGSLSFIDPLLISPDNATWSCPDGNPVSVGGNNYSGHYYLSGSTSQNFNLYAAQFIELADVAGVYGDVITFTASITP